MQKPKKYPSKLLLFGEYTVINGSNALAFPYQQYYGSWIFGKQQDANLVAFADYLEENQLGQPFLDITTFRKEIEQGLYFKSNIPIGYGLGSSGALCAAVYDRYALQRIKVRDTNLHAQLRKQLAHMESHFHDASSGVDPLICYLNHPVIIQPGSSIASVELPLMDQLPFTFFLLNTNITRRTGPLVRTYLTKCKQAEYSKMIADVLVPEVNQLIADFLKARWDKVEEAMKNISQFQLNNFSEMIPASIRPIWEEGLESGAYTLKLCGAGGGGFLLGIARERAALEKLNEQFSCEVIW